MVRLMSVKLSFALAAGVGLTLSPSVSAEFCIGGIQCRKDNVDHPAPGYSACVQLTNIVPHRPVSGNMITVAPGEWRPFKGDDGSNQCGVGIYNKGTSDITYNLVDLLAVGKEINEACFSPAKAQAAAAGGWTAGFCMTDGYSIGLSTKNSFYS